MVIMAVKFNSRNIRNLKGRTRSILLASVRNPEIIKLEKINGPVSTGFASYIDLVGKHELKPGYNLFFPFSGSGIITFEDGSEFGMDAEHRDLEIYYESKEFSLRLSNSIRFGRLSGFEDEFLAIYYKIDREMLDLYYRINIIIEIIEEFKKPEYIDQIERVLEMMPDLRVSLLSYIVHRGEFGESYETDDLPRKMSEFPEENIQSVDHSHLVNVKKQLDEIEKIVKNDLLSTNKTRVIPIGHSHIDLVWLWPIVETIEKDHRSFSAMAYMLKKHQFIFVQSMAWHYKFMEDRFPRLFREISDRIRENKWIPIGGMMVEPDCNIISGESLVRQVLYGQAYFREKFDKMSNISWLPDTFGFPAQLPQILKKSGFDLFVTTKMSWNDTNKFPYDTFNWNSPDGTSIIAHSHTRTYNSKTDFSSVMKTIRENSISSEKVRIVPLIYGYGDGGGGPNMKMLDEIKSLQKLTGVFVEEKDPLNFWVKELRSRSDVLPSLNGPLYLEYHRGTYTTHGDIKLHNRLLEGKLYVAEAMSVILNNIPTGNIFRRHWEILLKNQFHDIIPGSSINQVYKDSVKELQDIENELDAGNRERLEGFRSGKDSLTVFCPYSFNAKVWVPLEVREEGIKSFISPEGHVSPVLFDGKEHGFYSDFTKGIGFYNYRLEMGESPVQENKKITGNHKTGWNIISEEMNLLEIKRNGITFPVPVFYIFNDFPGDFDAWELDHHLKEDGRQIFPTGLTKENIQGFGSKVSIKYDLDPGFMVIKYTFSESDDFMNMDFHIDWKGNNRLLKIYFPVDGNKVKGEQPYLLGNQPDNKSAFEFPMHRVVAVDDLDKTFVLLNRTKYGYSMEPGFLGVTLLRSPVYPDPFADRGENRISFRFGYLKEPSNNQLIEEGIKFNIIPEAFNQHMVEAESFVQVKGSVLGSLKKMEKGNGIILRLVNYNSNENDFEVSTPWTIKEVVETDLLENPVKNTDRKLTFSEGAIHGRIRANEIVTLRVFAGINGK